MDTKTAMRAFAALSQPTRLNAFRILIEHEPDGLPAGLLAEKLAVPPNTLSSHLRALQDAGLVASQRDSRQIIYRARKEQVDTLAQFLKENCCQAAGKCCKPSKKKG
jgi:DNA-binding transcriptional ArsR family regulator